MISKGNGRRPALFAACVALSAGLVASGGSSSGGAATGTGGSKGGTTGGGGTTTSGGTTGSGGATTSGGTTGTGGNGGETPDASTDAGDGCAPTESSTLPTVADAIKVPAGEMLLHHFHAEGTQDYTCTASTDPTPTYAWSAAVPEAFLYDSCDHKVIQHSAGPQWKWLADDSTIKGTKLNSSAVANAIPELLLSAASIGSTGELSDVNYVQRLATSGGVSPAAGDCTASNVNEVQKIPYEATYYFYVAVPKDAGEDH
jgi:hypothetical protein